ncbi:hypothetical protein CNR22_00495 [Sphingobacteriaceae bacterium]|nr:hypothetical protein CNR22_00495 [Sphingobacteriaceae bacterium]
MVTTKIFIGSFFLLISCQSPEDARLEREYQFERNIDSLQMESFKIPDSINTALIIATYYDPENAIQSLLVFENADKKSVLKIDYLADRTSTVDELEILKPKEFRSNRFLVEYVVEDNSVHRIKMRRNEGPMQRSQEYRRTDRD